ncbi:MAG: CHASE3 domain-containing protein [Rhizomicrobium sp.]
MTQAVISLKTELRQFSRSEAWHSLAVQVLIGTGVLIVAALIMMSVTLSNIKRSWTESKATQDTLLQITTVESRLIEFDGALSTYALNGNPWFQVRMKTDSAEIHASLNQLNQSLQSDPLQLQRYNALMSLIQKRDVLDAYLSQPEHRSEIARSPVAQSARIVGDRIRNRLWKILDVERAKRQIHDAAMISQTQSSFLFAVGIVLLTFVFGALCLLLSVSAKAET